jgi:hypothetical protein
MLVPPTLPQRGRSSTQLRSGKETVTGNSKASGRATFFASFDRVGATFQRRVLTVTNLLLQTAKTTFRR